MSGNGTTPSSALSFPCDFIIKVVGRAKPSFEPTIVAIIHQHFPNFDSSTLSRRDSRDKHFIALTFTVHANNQAELDAIYQAISDCPDVIMAL